MTILQVTSPGLVLKFKLLLLAHHCQEDFSCLMLKSPASLEKLSIAASYLVKISSLIGQFLNFTGFCPHLVIRIPDCWPFGVDCPNFRVADCWRTRMPRTWWTPRIRAERPWPWPHPEIPREVAARSCFLAGDGDVLGSGLWLVKILPINHW